MIVRIVMKPFCRYENRYEMQLLEVPRSSCAIHRYAEGQVRTVAKNYSALKDPDGSRDLGSQLARHQRLLEEARETRTTFRVGAYWTTESNLRVACVCF